MSSVKSDLPIEAFDKEALVQRNPHHNFSEVEASRPDYDSNNEWKMSKTPAPGWQPGDGAVDERWQNKKFLTIDPFEPGRPMNLNYKLFVSTTVPRPIAIASTITADGKTRNLAPFSYWQNVCTDPPLYSLSLCGEEANDTLKNILETKECCISMTSDWLVEAMNFSSINTPSHVSEWELAGLTPHPSDVVKPPFVSEAAFSAECTLHSHQDMFSRVSGKRTATVVYLEVQRFHVWEDAMREDKATALMEKLRPVFRCGGITYGTCFDGFELPRPEAFRAVRLGEKAGRILQEADKKRKSESTDKTRS
ncbi:hypothetical protein BX600DRAFT_507229 [Xylariales sp. PMI_506]|nr:hypothetical protein BX600DRAFT_507229 [Xylariales sp. PMI_506]